MNTLIRLINVLNLLRPVTIWHNYIITPALCSFDTVVFSAWNCQICIFFLSKDWKNLKCSGGQNREKERDGDTHSYFNWSNGFALHIIDRITEMDLRASVPQNCIWESRAISNISTISLHNQHPIAALKTKFFSCKLIAIFAMIWDLKCKYN